MIALIEIPHQRPAKINWYKDRAALEWAAQDCALQSGREEPENFGEAVYTLADDWHMHLLVESAADIAAVESYDGHQKHRVRALVEELRAEFCEPAASEEE